MKRIETLTEKDRRAITRTLNDAARDGVASYSCCRGGECECDICPVAYDCTGLYVGELPTNTFIGWLTWLLDEVEKPEISSGYRVLITERINHYFIVRPDRSIIYAQGRPLTALFFDKQYIKVIDVFSSRDGMACILVKDNRNGENLIYIDKDI